MAFKDRSKLNDDLQEALLRRRDIRYDSLLNKRAREEGERLLRENDPASKSRINPHSVFWMIAAIAVFYYTDFYVAVRFDPRIHRLWMYIGGALIGFNLCVGCYCVLWLSYYKKITDWEKHSPYIIPLATASFIVGMICSIYALWPVWKFLTPFITFTMFMGVIFLATLIPV